MTDECRSVEEELRYFKGGEISEGKRYRKPRKIKPEQVSYEFGPYALTVTKTGKICGLCNQKFADEAELLRAYDAVARGGWQLVKYDKDGHHILRGTDADHKYRR
jgi:hypothetical protein